MIVVVNPVLCNVLMPFQLAVRGVITSPPLGPTQLISCVPCTISNYGTVKVTLTDDEGNIIGNHAYPVGQELTTLGQIEARHVNLPLQQALSAYLLHTTWPASSNSTTAPAQIGSLVWPADLAILPTQPADFLLHSPAHRPFS